ncbi:hypothetical protein WAI453_010608 [Rhynchosporium graminicola]|uniref:Vacuolar protein sorting/targeting protein 10 n=1 Tax=Rhynchosporium graminicola TaxID=2792576 RepID=A0A1E1JT02_9HELO|nr:related to carboxypeptidase Y-sorting protein PEP1 precursor [Rhynchosporium commune]
MRLHTATGWRSLLLSTLLYTGVWAKKEKPTVKSTKFNFLPKNVNYFEDSNVLLFEDDFHNDVYRSTDAGATWNKLDEGKGKMLEISMHPFDKKRAYIITAEKTHFKTSDQGKTWEKFETDAQATMFDVALTYHAGDPNRIIFNAMDCTGIFCSELTMYTLDGFAKPPKVLRRDTSGCHWAKSSELFKTGQKDLDNDRILCVVKGKFSPWRKDFRLLISDNFFQSKDGTIQEFEPQLESGRTVQGIVNMAVSHPFLVVAATADKTDEMALYISDDSIKWHRAVFAHDNKLVEEAYTLLEGTNYSIQIDVMTGRDSNPTGVFFSSNSNGTYFTRNLEHTNRARDGLVDFEKVYGIQGIILYNVVENWKDVDQKSNTEKKIISQISFDDGRTWEGLTADKDSLHLHSVTELSNSGRVYSSPAPGIMLGVGNTGKHLKGVSDANLYVSDDAGLNWKKALDGPHKYEFGDQGSILVAIKEGFHKEVRYSLDHGKSWEKMDLPEKIRPIQLTTLQDATSLKFLLEGVAEGEDGKSGHLVVLNFDDMHESQCKEDDMEKWYARVDSDQKPTCLMGHKQWYNRRKPDADCFLKKEFEDPEVHSEQCECTDADFECDYNFIRSADRKECEKAGDLIVPEGKCKAFGPDDTFKGSSGWRLIPGNDCKRAEGKQKDDPVDRKCVDAVGAPSSGKPGDAFTTKFEGKTFMDMVYLERAGISQGTDETVFVRTEAGVFWSTDHGKEWKQIFKDETILSIYPHTYNNDMVFFITKTEKVYYSTDRGRNIRDFKAPHKPNDKGSPLMTFHPKNKNWIIWIGGKGKCPGPECEAVASLTTDRGEGAWKPLERYVRKCEFIAEPQDNYRVPGPKVDIDKKSRDKLMYCEVRTRESNEDANNSWKLVSSDDFFVEKETHFTNVVDFATMSEFIVVATKDESADTLKAHGSVNGLTFADAQFPYNFKVAHQTGYTVLDSSTHAVFLHVTVSIEDGLEYGSIVKSNSNGTSYVLSLDAVDRDKKGYVDFEKMFGVEGVAMVNVVANYKAKNFKKEGKKLKTMISHNDGGEWAYLKPPPKDADNKQFSCSDSNLEKCSLNIHGYTERSDKSHTYSSASAIGLMLGTGNVGEHLTAVKDADTFMTSDGGVNWKSVKKGSYMWEFGDQGSIVVIVKEREKTKVVYYSEDEGDTWKEKEFAQNELKIYDLTTVPSDNSRKFLLWGHDGSSLVTIHLDFTPLTDVQCKLNEYDPEADDYYLWIPKHPSQEDDCLFGHVTSYHRKRPDKKCFNGPLIPNLYSIERNCSCTRRDFECDFNYQRQSDGSCALVPGLTPLDHSLICKEDDNLLEYDDPTGYRRIPLSTCVGGKEFDKSVPHPCPGKGEQFKKKHGVSGFGIFFIALLCIGVAAGVGWWVWTNIGNFGQIRLGEQSTASDDEPPYVKYPKLVLITIVMVVTGAAALVSSLWRDARTTFGASRPARFTTRDSFARGRDDYDVVDDDEGELLGEESDEEV